MVAWSADCDNREGTVEAEGNISSGVGCCGKNNMDCGARLEEKEVKGSGGSREGLEGVESGGIRRLSNYDTTNLHGLPRDNLHCCASVLRDEYMPALHGRGVYNRRTGKMKTRMFDLDDACNHITLRSDGCISVESVFKKGFDGDYKLLISCVEDNANGIIDWPAVETDYRAQNR